MRLRSLLLFVLVASRAAALDPARPLDLHALDSWREGLPQYMVRSVVQTRDGYLWVGTMEGLARFNGLQFEVFDSKSTPALRDHRVDTLAEDPDGTLWIGTFDGGLVRARDGRFEGITTAQGLASDVVSAMRVASDGSLWVGGKGTVTHLAKGRFTRYGHAEGIPEAEIEAIAEGRDGALFVATAKGLCRLEGGRFVLVTAEPVNCLAVARDGTLWAGTMSDRVLRYAPGSATPDVLLTGLPTLYVNDILEDTRGTVWLATAPTGLLRHRGGRLERLDKAKGLPSNAMRVLLEDREGSVWIGTDNGLARLKDLKFVNYTARHGLADDALRVVTESRRGGLWIGTYGAGVSLLRDGRFTSYGEADGLEDLFVRTLLEAPSGALYVGTGRGLFLLEGGRARRAAPTRAKIDALHLRRDGTLLVATPADLFALRDGRLEVFLPGQSEAAEPRAILEREDGTLWLGSYAGLLQVKDGAVVRRFTTKNGLPSDMVFALHDDPGGDLWIGTHDGLARLRGGRIQAVTAREGLPNGVVFQILDDRAGHFWLTSPRGLARVERASIEDVLAGRAASVRASAYGKSDGMGSDQCGGATQPAGARLADGRLAIPTAAGLTLVDPGDLHVNTVPPVMVLRDVLVDGRRVAAGAELPWSSTRYEFRYDGLSLLMPELVRFRYRVDGFDGDWVEAGGRRIAFYNSLPAGAHVFRVTAANNDGVWSEEARLPFTLPAPPWRRWWAVALYALVGAGLVALAVRVRVAQMKRRTELLEAKVQERTTQLAAAEARAVEANRAKSVFLANMSHELRTPLNAVIGFAQLMARSRTLSDSDRESVAVIRRGGEHLLGLINDVLSISKIEAGRLTLDARPFDPAELIRAVSDMVRVRAEAAGLALVVEASPFPPAVAGDAGKLRQVLLNLLGNAVKFTAAGTVTLRARWSDGRAAFEVADTGHGIAEGELPALFQPFVQTESGRQAKEGTGLGLVITRQLVRLMGGEIAVESRRGAGTTFRFDVELPATEQRALPRERRRRVAALAPGEHRRVLVVDDTRDSRVLLVRLLQSVGFEVREAANGREAVELWRSYRPQLIFMDQRMPLMDGSEATREIRRVEAEERRSRTSIVALTASVFEHEKETILSRGADEFLVKPYAEEAVFDALARHLGVRYLHEEERPAPTGNRVLLVDDDEIARAVARQALEGLGLDVTEVAGGAAALALLERESFDAVLLDLEMPGMNGRVTVQAIRSRERLRELPVIAMSAHDRSDAETPGMTDYLGKPIDEERLARVLGRFVRVTATP